MTGRRTGREWGRARPSERESEAEVVRGKEEWREINRRG